MLHDELFRVRVRVRVMVNVRVRHRGAFFYFHSVHPSALVFGYSRSTQTLPCV